MITLFGSEDFPQFRKVKNALYKETDNIVILDYKLDKELAFYVSPSGKINFEYGDQDLTKSKVVWRSDKFICSDFGDDTEWAKSFTRNKIWRASINNIASILNCPVVNSIESRQRCENKLMQLSLASQAGFKIPNSLITNSIAKITQHSKTNTAITKMLGDPHLPVIDNGVKQTAISTCRIDANYIQSNPDKLEPFPLFIQHEIKKKMEYRCILVNDKIFTLSIDPKQHPIMEVDYRLGGYMVDYKPSSLPKQVEEKLFKIAQRLGLFSGCFDLIEDIDGNYIFLEVNHHGVWGLHDDILEGQISKKVADSLLKIAYQD